MYKYRFSIFTATYNRERTLPRVYKSLLEQSFKDFEWIVVDDGSEDNTEELIKSYQLENKLRSIRYFKKENGGKHTAWRMATKLFEGRYVVTLDSDDCLLPQALEIFDKNWKKIESSSDYNDFWEIKSRTISLENKELVGKRLPADEINAYSNEFVFKNDFFVELDACRKVEVLKKEAKVPNTFLYEEYCSNLPELIRWFRAGRIYKTKYIEDVTSIYTTQGDDRLSSSSGKSRKRKSTKLTYNNLVGCVYMLSESGRDMLKWNKKRYFRNIALFLYSSFALKINPFNIPHKQLYFSPNKAFMILAYIPVFILYLIRK